MVATYTAVATAKDRVRLEIGDTDVAANAILQDEEIAYYLTAESDNVLQAAARAAYAIAARYAQRPDSLSAGGTSVSWSSLAERFRTLAASLTERATEEAGLSAAPYAGGISASDVLTRELDTDRVVPFFSRDQVPEEPKTTEVYR